jgi:hypothetical protein
MRRLKAACGTILAVALVATAITAMSASAGDNEAGENQLVGTWTVSVNRGPTLPPLQSLQAYNKGGTGVETANGGARARSAAVFGWERASGRTYTTTAMFFRYDPVTDAYLGTVKLRHTLELSRDGDSFTGFAVAEFRDPAGNLLPGSNARRDAVSGTRIDVEAPPAIP